MVAAATEIALSHFHFLPSGRGGGGGWRLRRKGRRKVGDELARGRRLRGLQRLHVTSRQRFAQIFPGLMSCWELFQKEIPFTQEPNNSFKNCTHDNTILRLMIIIREKRFAITPTKTIIVVIEALFVFPFQYD